MGLTSGDYADVTAALLELVPAGRRLVFLEGGYDLDALRTSSASTLGALAGGRVAPEAPTSGGPGRDVVTAAQLAHRRVVGG
jgi:acetoin utilization deacetylase AcuC-like enzyme